MTKEHDASVKNCYIGFCLSYLRRKMVDGDG